ncbi:MAG TPA: hypothetical protein VK184_01350 [Nostocaceae cyanobacterium]|nr:hypothetical protein [Nostocaceae cyanobacterium]
MLIEELTQALRKTDTEAHEAALTLGLLIERERVNYFPSGTDGGIQKILGDQFANYRLSETYIKNIIDEMLSYINDESLVPHAMVVWALTKSYEERILPHLIRLFDRVIKDPNQENLAYQTLLGIINIGLPSSYRELSISVIRKAAKQGHERVMETAVRYLEIFNL